MIRSALQSFYRSLLRHPLYAGINLLGLAFGIAVFILLSLFVQFETGYDTWLPGSDHVYAVTYNARIRKAEHQPARYMSAAYVLDAVRRLYPELTGTRIDGDYMNIRLGGRVVAEEGNSVDKAFFHVFDIPVIAGDREAALDAPDGLILSERMARKYFATTDVIGRTLIIRDEPGPLTLATKTADTEKRWRIMAVLRDAPANTTLRFDILRPRQTVPHNAYWFAWSSQFRIRTYFRLDARDHRRLEAGLVPAIKAYPLDDDQARSYFKHFFDDTEIALQPYSSEHLADPRVRRAIAAIDMAGVLAFVVSLINYVNLATARGGIRAREVAIRKTAGATRPRLVAQFLSEALLLGTAAMAIAFSLVELSLPVLNHLGHLSLRLDYWRDSPTLLALAAAVLAGSAIAGLYPAVVLSGFHPAQGLSATRTPAGGRIGHIVREILAVVQFIAASAFFIIIAGLAAQVRHMETAELGFARDGLLITDAMITRLMPPEKALAIQDAWRRTPGIVAVAAGPVPGRYFIAPRWRFRTDGRADEIDMQMAWMEGDFFAAYRTGRLAGRLLNADDDLGRLGIDPVVADIPHAKITANAVINLSAVRSLGFVSPAAAVGRTVTLGQAVFRVVGVVADQRFKAPTQKQMPFLYVYSARCVIEADSIVAYDGIGEDTARGRLEAAWRTMAPDMPLDLQSGRDALDYYYADDRRNARLFAIGGIAAGLIGAVGLFGMAAFNTSARVQEIGVRKSFGASRWQIIRLLMLQLLRPVLIANLVAWPVSFIVLDGWLKPFDDRIAMNPLFFAAGSGLSLMIAILTVFSVAMAASRTPPGNALRQV